MTKEEFNKYSPYFKYSEFDSPDKPGSGLNMKKEFMDRIYELRKKYGRAMVITSGYRTKKHNAAIHGKADSSHLIGYAADISIIGSSDRYLFVKAAMEVGFNRIGIGSNFIHIDCDPNKSPDVIWTYAY